MEFTIKDIVQAVAILIIGVIIAWEKAKRWHYKRNGKDRRSNNPHQQPGFAQTCKDHGEDIATIKANIITINGQVERIFKKLNNI